MSDCAKVTLPSEWEDDERMNFMFSDFKENRDVNTMDWDSKMGFWTPLILQSCRDRGTVCFSLRDLTAVFQRKGSVPLGLSTVIQGMIRCGAVQRESEFAANVDCGWLSWGVGLLLVKPLRWTFSTLLGSSRVPLEESFVIVERVKEKAAELLEAYRRSEFASRSVLSFQELATLLSHVCADESSLCMALLQLQREKQVTVSLHDGEKIVKFCQPGHDRVSPISDVDIGIYQLQRSEKLLEERVEALGQEADRCKEEARVLLRDKKKSQALRCLRGSKRVEKRADKLFDHLESIRGILDRIAQSQTDKTVVQAYQAGVSALRVSLKDVTVERAESLVDQIQELCDTQDEVNQTLAGGLPGADVDVDELEEELKSLLEESKPDSVLDLPRVPTKPVSPAREPSLAGGDVLSWLPPVPQSFPSITDKELEEELNRLTLADSGVPNMKATSPTKSLEPTQ
ncbi:charged multivesicular body protein 7 [Genypterus blacodes]|uniref:charged multivesicular body protein 7 n=1 Tax=Genypterus blacodes TaxID=154954 RepID=UPI003F759D19